jgi:hypothetical protein
MLASPNSCRRRALATHSRLPTRWPDVTWCKVSSKALTDLRFAGISKRDDRGRVFDVHAFRHTFGTLLSRGGVAPRTAQAAMRHSKIDVKMNVYTDSALLDVRGALDMLPALLLGGERTKGEAVRATGTDPLPPAPLGATVAPTGCNRRQFESSPVKQGGGRKRAVTTGAVAVTSIPVKTNQPLTSAVSGFLEMGATGLEPVTPSVSSNSTPDPSSLQQRVAESQAVRCTSGCTAKGENGNASTIQVLAAAVEAQTQLPITVASRVAWRQGGRGRQG